MTTSAVPHPGAGEPAPLRPIDTLFGGLWPEDRPAGRPRTVAAGLLVGLAAALVLPFREVGVGTTAVLLAIGATVLLVGGLQRTPYQVTCVILAGLLVLVPTLRAAVWIDVLCVLAALVLGAVTLTDARSLVGMGASLLSLPLGSLRGMPWLGRSVHGDGRTAAVVAVLRTVVLSLVMLGVFGGLFASADPLFSAWLGALLPDLTADTLIFRMFVLVVVAGVTLAGCYTALNPPRIERLAMGDVGAVRHRFEWLVPVGVVLAVYLGFVVAQLSVMFGGHDYLRRTTGVTYADYVHQGFGQLTLATALTLGVVALAARKADRSTPADRLLLRGALGLLCLLTLVVVASALYRLHVYEQAYGFTQLRLLVAVFEAWLGVVVVIVIIAGVGLSARWVPRAVLLTGAIALLGLAAINPDGYVAERNVDRYVETGKADWSYLAGLSPDAVPALRGLPPSAAQCVLAPQTDNGDWLEWNLGRARSDGLIPADAATCP